MHEFSHFVLRAPTTGVLKVTFFIRGKWPVIGLESGGCLLELGLELVGFKEFSLKVGYAFPLIVEKEIPDVPFLDREVRLIATTGGRYDFFDGRVSKTFQLGVRTLQPNVHCAVFVFGRVNVCLTKEIWRRGGENALGEKLFAEKE